jgi:hypothetical protein
VTVVTAHRIGSATITVTTVDGNFPAICTVTVRDTPKNVELTTPSKAETALKTGISADNLDETNGKAYLKKSFADSIAKSLLRSDTAHTNVLPVFEASITPAGATARVTFNVLGKDMLASFADDIHLIGMISGSTGKRFEYVNNAGEFADAKFTLMLDGQIHEGDIDPNKVYEVVIFIKDGGEYDLDNQANGHIIGSVFFATERKGGSGGGCSAGSGFLALALLGAVPLVLRRK